VSTPKSAIRLDAIWRYPVKSLQGEQLSEAALDSSGLRGDRCWGIRDETTGKILTGRREPQLLLAAASLEDGEPKITLPSGELCRGIGPETDAALSHWLQRPVTLVESVGASGGEAEFFADATDDASPAIAWTMPAGRFVDAMPILLVTTASVRTGAALCPDGDWDVRRFRPNLFVDVGGDLGGDVDGEGWIEDSWCGRAVRIGAAVVEPSQPCVRCTMVTRPQPGLARDLDIYKTVARHHGGTFGVWAQVHTPAHVKVGDAVVVAES
jgi:uncharacterized protein YcbX